MQAVDHPYDLDSRCSAGTRVQFHWYGLPGIQDSSVDTAVASCMRAVRGDKDRLWSPWNTAVIRSEFADRIRAAEEGKLTPIDQVKPVDIKNPPPLFEIRWEHITITERDPDNPEDRKHRDVNVRLYHSEPEAAPGFFIGHHTHEKALTGDVYAQQSAEIKTAIGWYNHGRDRSWNLPDLPPAA